MGNTKLQTPRLVRRANCRDAVMGEGGHKTPQRWERRSGGRVCTAMGRRLAPLREADDPRGDGFFADDKSAVWGCLRRSAAGFVGRDSWCWLFVVSARSVPRWSIVVNRERFQEIADRYRDLRVALVGDFCLDRYLEIDPARRESSIETGREVHNVVRVRSQPGGAGTILNNLAALGIGTIYPVGFCGEDGEGYELLRALQARAGVELGRFLQTPERRTFTYCKPLVVGLDGPPVELNRLDSKNWTPTPPEIEEVLGMALRCLVAADAVDAIILLDQVDLPETGVVTRGLLEVVREIARERPELLILADSRRGLREFPPVTFKMNAAELARLTGAEGVPGALGVAENFSLATVQETAAALARRNGQRVFVTLAERGMVGAAADGRVEQVGALPVRGPIDIVGAGDAVTANLTAALAAGATVREALVAASCAASLVIHQLGTTGTATVAEIGALLPE